MASPNVDVNGIDDQGNSALIQAARFGHDEVVAALLIAKADVKTKNDEGKTAKCWQPKADMMKRFERLPRLVLGSRKFGCN